MVFQGVLVASLHLAAPEEAVSALKLVKAVYIVDVINETFWFVSRLVQTVRALQVMSVFQRWIILVLSYVIEKNSTEVGCE
jgi:hypothetical protein